MSDTIVGVIIGGLFGFIGAILGVFSNAWLEGIKERTSNLKEIRLRLVGDRIQTSEVMEYIESQRKQKYFRWKTAQPDLSRTNLKEVDLRNHDLNNIKFFRVNFTNADLDNCNLSKSDLSKATLESADISSSDLSSSKS